MRILTGILACANLYFAVTTSNVLSLAIGMMLVWILLFGKNDSHPRKGE